MLKPLEDRVLIKMYENEEKTKSGIILTGNNKEKSQIAKVIQVGPGNEKVKIEVKKDDKVIINKYAGIQVEYDGQDLFIVNYNDILAIIE